MLKSVQVGHSILHTFCIARLTGIGRYTIQWVRVTFVGGKHALGLPYAG